MASIPGSVRVTGVIAPTDSTDTYAVTDNKYGIDGLRNFSGNTSELNSISQQRRRAGMIAGVLSGGTRLYFRLNEEPWSYNASDWTQLSIGDYSGSTVILSGLSYWTSGATSSGLLNINSSHTVEGNFAIAAGGFGNTIEQNYSSILGGFGNVIYSEYSTVIGGIENKIYGINNSTLGRGLVASGYGQTVIGVRNIEQGNPNTQESSNYMFIIGGGDWELETNVNAFAVRQDGIIQTNPLSSGSLPTVGILEGALAFSANTGLYQFVNGAWTGFTSGSAGGGGSQTWDQTLQEGNIALRTVEISGSSSYLHFYNDISTKWSYGVEINNAIISGSSGHVSIGSLIESRNSAFTSNYVQFGVNTAGSPVVLGNNGTASGILHFSAQSQTRNWIMPDASGTVALVSQLTGNTGGAPQVLQCLNPTTTWNLDFGHNASLALTANTTLSITNVSAGDYGTLVITQGAGGGNTISPPASSVVVNGAGGILNITSNANAIDLLTFYYDGSTFYWNLGGDYT